MEAFTRIKNLNLDFINSFALKCAIDLDIAGHIQNYGQPMPLNELARSIPIPAEKEWMLSRLMALFVHHGTFAQSEQGYMLTPVSDLLIKKGNRVGAYALMTTVVEIMKGWSRMSELFTDADTSSTVFQKASDGKQLWEILEEFPQYGTLFNDAMAGQSIPVITGLVTIYSNIFCGLRTLVDVGGGTGISVKIISEAFPKLRCTVFDLPHVIEESLKSDSFDLVGGDMFEKIPTADAIFLKNVLHDWSDEDCVRILKRCKEAIESTEGNNNGGKVIVVDIVVDADSEDPVAIETSLLSNINMMCVFGAKERYKKEWHDIIMAAGFSSYKIGATRLGVDSVIELYP